MQSKHETKLGRVEESNNPWCTLNSDGNNSFRLLMNRPEWGDCGCIQNGIMSGHHFTGCLRLVLKSYSIKLPTTHTLSHYKREKKQNSSMMQVDEPGDDQDNLSWEHYNYPSFESSIDTRFVESSEMRFSGIVANRHRAQCTGALKVIWHP